MLVQQGIAKHDPEYAAKILGQPMPDSMARELGVKPGKTFEQQWPSKLSTIKQKIKAGYAKQVDAELKYQKADGKKLAADFIADAKEKARNGQVLTTQEVNAWKQKAQLAGVGIPEELKTYETNAMLNQRVGEQYLESLAASQEGRLTREQLQTVHPLAAAKYWDKVEKWEEAALKDFDSELKIKSFMDVTFKGMGVKDLEKSPAYVEAMSNAKIDYGRKYNQLIAMNYPPSQASHWALHARPGQVTGEDGQPLNDFTGVVTEIKENRESSKYVITGQAIEKEIKPGRLRVARVASGKREMRDDSNIIINGTIGGDYGRRQLDSIAKNLEKYGDKRGLYMDKSARQYYEGLARGRDGNWMGLVDKQLKAIGHEGLWPDRRPPEQDLFEGKDKDGTPIEDPQGLLPLAKAIERASKYPTASTYWYTRNTVRDCWQTESRNPYSCWDTSPNLSPYILGGQTTMLPKWYTMGGNI